ncbi:MAG: T9SS type A sorting domain-containing protein [Chitinophagales bacterium]
MKKLSMLIVLVSLMGINAFAQTARTAPLKATLQLAKPAEMGASSSKLLIQDCDTFANLCASDTFAVIYTYGTGLYVSGQNSFGDISKADIFQTGGTTIKGVLIWFGVGKAANTIDKFNVRVWENDGTFNDGVTPGAPGSILSSKLVKYSDVAADVLAGALTYVQFSPAVPILNDGIYYIGVDFGYKNGDTIAVRTTLDRTGTECEGIVTAVEQWSPSYPPGGWIDYNSSWGFNGISHFILPITCQEVCELNITPGSPDICKNKSKVLTATGATTYTWAPAAGLDVTTGAVVTAEPTATTTYTVTGDGGACVDFVTVTVLDAPTSNFTVGNCISSSRLLTRTGTPTSGVTFKWFRNGVKITGGATNSTYLATISGAYKVQTKITATGCKKVSGEKNVTIDCKAGISGSAFTAEAYPNPFNQSVTINMASGSTELANVRLIDLSGRTLHEYVGVDTSAPFEINENLAPGVYFVRVSQGNTEKMIKVVKE